MTLSHLTANCSEKRVLIVDDEPSVLLMLAESLEALDSGCIIETVANAKDALVKIQQEPYDLVITDYKMPGMNGLDLARVARRISPDTRIVLMTAFGTDGLKDAADKLQLSGYLSKPFSIKQIRSIVERAVAQTAPASLSAEVATFKPPDHSLMMDTAQRTRAQSIYAQLQTLQSNTGARCIVLLSSSGYPIDTAGQTGGLDVSTISALVAANFIAASELARLLGRGSVFKSSYHEGQDGTDYNIYAYDVNGDYLLAVVFGVESKPGVVWLYTKQTATLLAEILKKVAAAPPDSQVTGEPAGEAAYTASMGETLSMEQAIRAGLLPAEFSQHPTAIHEVLFSEMDALWGADSPAVHNS